MGFRPLPGILIFNELTKRGDEMENQISFRPLPGILIFNYNKAFNDTAETLAQFPSPSGDFCF